MATLRGNTFVYQSRTKLLNEKPKQILGKTKTDKMQTTVKRGRREDREREKERRRSNELKQKKNNKNVIVIVMVA